MPFSRLTNWWENVRASLWYLPSLYALLAAGLSVAVPELDRRVADDIAGSREWLFSGSPSAARTLLSVIGGALVTVISLLFSLTIITVQQASSQFSPRIIRTFTRDRGNQTVLGIYIATFLYALLVLRQIRDETDSSAPFVPLISVTLAIALAVLCLGALVYFVHHVTTQLQASTVIERIHAELLDAIETLYPAALGEPLADAAESPAGDLDLDLASFRARYPGPSLTVHATSSGFLRTIDEGAIADGLAGQRWAIVYPRVGTYVVRGTPLVELAALDGAERADALRRAFVLDSQRSVAQDALFDVRQLVDIALKALSPSILDPTTAEHVIACLADALVELAGREFPPRTRLIGEEGARVALWVDRPAFDDYVHASFDQIRAVARDDLHVTTQLAGALEAVARAAPPDRVAPLQAQLDGIAWQLERVDADPRDVDPLHRQVAEVRLRMQQQAQTLAR